MAATAVSRPGRQKASFEIAEETKGVVLAVNTVDLSTVSEEEGVDLAVKKNISFGFVMEVKEKGLVCREWGREGDYK